MENLYDSEKKVLKLVPDTPYFNHVKVGVYDKNEGDWRKRCMIDVEYDDSDIEQIKKSLGTSEGVSEGASEGTSEGVSGGAGSGGTRDAGCDVSCGAGCDTTEDRIIEYYRDWMHDLIKRLISSDWVAEEGEEEVLAIVREHIADSNANL